MEPGVATNKVIGRNIYRTLAGGSTFFYLASLSDNTTTTYNDTAADSTLAGKPQPPAVNTSGVMVWPPYERAFSEYSNMYDSNAALAAGGNIALMGAVADSGGLTGTQSPAFTLSLSPAELPKDNSLAVRIFYATKQQLHANGSTIPEIHHDVIVLGAVAYAIEAYQVPTTDNFDLQDVRLTDRVDDTIIPSN